MRAGWVALTLLSSCMLFNASRSNKQFGALATVRGSVTGAKDGKPTFVVLLRDDGQGWRPISNRVLYGAGPFEILADPGKLQAFAFVDEDGDGHWSEHEPSAAVEQSAPDQGAVIDCGELEPKASGPKAPIAIDLRPQDVRQELIKIHRGDVVTLEDERFAANLAKSGFWDPATFALQNGAGVSFLEPYDPKRVPVIFVHGAQGSPRHFTKLIETLDRSRFQAWVFSYPTGVRLELAAGTLQRVVDDLQLELGFERVAVVAHSMGGLVAHRFVSAVMSRPAHRYVGMLVTVSTPFDGHEMAQAGVKTSPVVVPCWMDMAAGSPFLVSLRKPLPDDVPHHVLFSYVGGSRGGGPTDGVVSVRSMLEPQVQANAASVHGFAETHMGILENAEALELVNQLLGDAANGHLASAGCPRR